MIFRHRIFTGDNRRKATIVFAIAQEWKDVTDTLAQHFLAAETGDSLHCSIPGDKSAILIKREHTVDAGVDHTL